MMTRALALNPGSASLKFEVIEMAEDQAIASAGRKLVSASIEGIGNKASLLVFRGREIASREPCNAQNMTGATSCALRWLRDHDFDEHALLENLAFAGVRVVHGGSKYRGAIRSTPNIRSDIEALEELAPLHNQSAVAILALLQRELPRVPVMVAFDTAFHRTLPEVAWRYPIDREIADRFGIRKFGFHGLSHRYMLEQYAQLAGKAPDAVSVITLHLESGCSACAIAKGQSIDTTMGLTPLEGLMMGTRSGSIDPALVPFLMQKLNATPDQVMTLLNKKSGLLGIAGQTFDTRDLVRRTDDAAKLALAMFSYRIRLAVGAYLAALGDAEAILFGGGIGEDTPSIRAAVCRGLRSLGLELDEDLNARVTAGQARIARPESRLAAWVIPVEEGLQMVHECWLAMRASVQAVLPGSPSAQA